MPKVVWASYADWAVQYGGEAYWDVGKCHEKYNYYCEFADLCKSELIHSNSGSIENQYQDGDYHMTSEEFFEFAKDADYWIYPAANFDKAYSQFEDELNTFKSVQNAGVYDVQGSGPGLGAWFEHRFAEPDIILQDFCEVVGMNNDAVTPHSRVYFRKTLPDGGETLVESATCSKDEIDLPWVSKASECVYLTESPTASPTGEDQVGSPTEPPTELPNHANKAKHVASILVCLSILLNL